MKPLFTLAYAAILACAACNNAAAPAEAMRDTSFTDTGITRATPVDTAASGISQDDTTGTTATYYLVVTDTGMAYGPLLQKMLQLKQQTGLDIDTMGRYYNANKNLIALPDNDPDEIYAGDYFPRRYPGTTLSIEYLDFYRPAAAKNMAIVAGMYENPEVADSALGVLKKHAPLAFSFSAKIYIGCTH